MLIKSCSIGLNCYEKESQTNGQEVTWFPAESFPTCLRAGVLLNNLPDGFSATPRPMAPSSQENWVDRRSTLTHSARAHTPRPPKAAPGLKCQSSAGLAGAGQHLPAVARLAQLPNSREKRRKDRSLGQSCSKSWFLHLLRGCQEHLLGSF